MKGLCCFLNPFWRVNSGIEAILRKTTAWLMQAFYGLCIMHARWYFPALLPLCSLITFACAVVEKEEVRRHQEEERQWWMRSDARQGRFILHRKKKHHWFCNQPPAARRPPRRNVRACQVRGSRRILIEWGELGTTHPDVCFGKVLKPPSETHVSLPGMLPKAPQPIRMRLRSIWRPGNVLFHTPAVSISGHNARWGARKME